MKLKSLRSLFKKRLNLFILFFSLFIVLFAASVIFFVTSSYFALKVKNYASFYLTKTLHKQVHIEKLRISVFAPQIDIKGLSVKDVAYIKDIKLFFGPLDFFRRKITIDKIDIIHPELNLLVKDKKIDNYKTINLAIKSLTKKSSFSFISFSFQNIYFHDGDFKLNDLDNRSRLKLVNFNLDIFKKPKFSQISKLFYSNNGIYFNFNIPRISLNTPSVSQVYSLSAVQIHYFSGYVKFNKVVFRSNYFSSVSNGILFLQKRGKISPSFSTAASGDIQKAANGEKHSVTADGKNKSEITRIFKKVYIIVNKVNETTTVNFAHLSRLGKSFKTVPINLKGALNLKIHVAGDFSKKIHSSAHIHLKNFVFEGGEIKDGIINCGGDFGNISNQVLKFTEINLKMFNGIVKSTGDINLNENEGKFNSTLKDIDVGKLINFYDSEKIPQFKSIADGNVKTIIRLGKNFYVANIEKITVNKPVQQLKFRDKNGKRTVYSIDYGRPVLLTGTVSVNNKIVLLKNIHASSADLSGNLNGVISYGKSYLNMIFKAKYKRLPGVNFIKSAENSYFKPEASGVIDGIIAGKFNSISLDLRNRFNSLFINKYMDYYKGDANIDIKPSGEVLFKRVNLAEIPQKPASAGGVINFSGRIFENKILKTSFINGVFDAKNINVFSKRASLPLSLHLNASGNIGGELNSPVVNIFAGSKSAYVHGQKISGINLSAILTKKKLQIKKLNGTYIGSKFNIDGAVIFKPESGSNFNYNLQLVATGINLSNLNIAYFNKYRVSGTANADLHIGGLFALPSASGNVVVGDIHIGSYYLANINIGVSASHKNMVLNLSAQKNQLIIKADILLKKGYPYSFASDIKLLNVGYRGTLIRLSGGIYGSGRLSDIKNSSLFTKLSYLQLKHGPFFLKNTKNIRISYINKDFSLSGFELRGGNNYLHVRGDITPEKYNIVVNYKTDLWILELLSKKIVNSSGFMDGSVVAFGSKAHPQIYGYAEIKKGLLETSLNPDYSISRVFARLTFNNNLLVLERARFRLLNGFFSTHGIVRLENFRPVLYDLKGSFSSLIYRPSNHLYVDMDGDIGYRGSLNNGTVYGNINIKKALYDKKIHSSAFILNYKKYISSKPVNKNGMFNPKLNLLIKSGKHILVKNNIINTAFSADLSLKGRLSSPILIGVANARTGNLYFRGTKFRLSYANIDFNNPYTIDPSFVVSANTHINQYIIRINVSGNLLNFDVNLSSAPPLSELDIVSMLALGAPSSSVYAGSAGGIAASEAASAIGGSVTEGITGAISSYFGFKNLSVAPSYSVVTHSAAPQVTVTKSITKKLSISYSNIISSQSSQSVTLTYTLTPHISVIGVWENNELAPNNSNIYSEVGGNIVFHFRFY